MNSENDLAQTLSTLIWKGRSIKELKKNITADLNICRDELLMVYYMFEEMGLTGESAKQCLRLLVETDNIPENYIRTLCFLWYKYKLYTSMQDDLFNPSFLIHQNKMYIYNLFRYQLKPLLGINEEKDIVLKEFYKHQADISKSLELAYLTETRNLFDNTNVIDNDYKLVGLENQTLKSTIQCDVESNKNLDESTECNQSYFNQNLVYVAE